MTPEEVAVNFHGECKRDHNWCMTHETHWPDGKGPRWPPQPPVTPVCPEMLDYIDLCEQMVEAYQSDLRAQVMALPDDHHYGPVGKNRCVKRADVLALIPENSDD